MKKALVLASVASMIDQFNMPNIRLLIEMGYHVDVACNFVNGSTCSDEKVSQLKAVLDSLGVGCFQIDFARNVLKVSQNLKAYSQTRRIVKEGRYDLIHSHSPIGGLLSRLAARDMRIGNGGSTKVIYTAHGFHFFKGAPLLNWMIFYPIEWVSSYLTDTLITITKEDYARATERMHAGKVEYIPGVGIDVKKFRAEVPVEVKLQKRQELGVGVDDVMVLSVGELNKNKNHEVVIRAIAKLGRKDVHYVIAGRGALKEYLENLAVELGIGNQLHLLGFRTDIKELYKVADVFAHPSFREGLSVAVMEAMASEMPIVCTAIRGNTDLIDEGKGGCLFNPADVDGAYTALKQIVENADRKALGLYNTKKAEGLDVHVILDKMKEIYEKDSDHRRR